MALGDRPGRRLADGSRPAASPPRSSATPITRFAVFLCTGHAGQTKPRGREVEEIEKRRRTARGLAGHRVAGAA